MIRTRRPDGDDTAGYLAVPEGGEDVPLVLVLHEWWGLTEDVRDVADRLAAEGYRALAVDMYRGFIANAPLDGMRRLKSFDFCAAAEQDIRGALEQMRAGGRAAILGFSLGSAVALIAAERVPGCDAAIGFYGIPRDTDADPRGLRVPVQVHFAESDDFFRPAAIARFEAKLRESAAGAEIYRYQASHGFFSTRPGGCYDPHAASAAWERALAFLAKHLRPT